MISTGYGVPGPSRLARMADMLAMLIIAVTMTALVILSNYANASDAPAAGAAHAAQPAARSTAAVITRVRWSSSPYHPVSVSSRARTYYLSVWGVDNLLAHQTAAGRLIRFSYRVVDPARAKLLSDKRATPYMYGERSHALLHVPVMEQVGPLRQSTPPKEGKEYWMVFSNQGNYIHAGDRVDVIIGAVHVDGLLVE